MKNIKTINGAVRLFCAGSSLKDLDGVILRELIQEFAEEIDAKYYDTLINRVSNYYLDPEMDLAYAGIVSPEEARHSALIACIVDQVYLDIDQILKRLLTEYSEGVSQHLSNDIKRIIVNS